MAIPKRHATLPGTYFVTSRTWERRSLFAKEAVARIVVESILHYRDEGAYQLHAFVVMPDHFHIMLTPSPETTLERAVQYIKGGSAHRIGAELGFRLPVWQRGFSDHRIRDPRDYETHLLYIEENSLKRGLVRRVGDYPWSSAGGQFKLDEPPQRLKPLAAATSFRHG